MTLRQINSLANTLEEKVKEGLKAIKEISIDSPSYQIVLNNIIASTTLASKLRIDNTNLKDTKGGL
jgi:TATA-box binding protein (TBP) (component of TFIID and TFIIIB)